MISAMLCGGLGSRMFQIATAYALALDNNDECAFDLNMGSISQDHQPSEYRDNVFSKLKELPEGWIPEFQYQQKRYDYDPIPYRKNMIIGGYYASERYFSHRRKEVIELFTDQKTIDTIKLNFKNSVSVHVRRGDYLINASHVCPESYYKKSLELIDKDAQIDSIHIVSDDITWCKDTFKDERIIFWEDVPDYIDFYIQTLTSHNIISNSTFSRMATFLNDSPGKIVYAPATWFGPDLAPLMQDIFLNDWRFI